MPSLQAQNLGLQWEQLPLKLGQQKQKPLYVRHTCAQQNHRKRP
jgi:hypothetical protein